MTLGQLPTDLAAIVDAALAEDGAHTDATTRFLGLSGRDIEAAVVVHAAGVIAGLGVARAVFAALDPAVEFVEACGEAVRVEPGATIARLSGDAAAIVSGERVALNFLQRLSGIATHTARFVERIAGTGVTILDTRKTTPLLRALEKYAVTAGGGSNHRFNLADMMLIKENHLRSVGVEPALDRLRKPHKIPIEIEVDSFALLERALALNVDRIMLDNFSPGEVEQAVKVIAKSGRTVAIEVSGGVTLDNVRSYAIPGVDFISVGALTHAAPWLDISLEVRPTHG